MHVAQWEIERLKANPANYREHPPEQVAEIRASIERFGWRKPVVARPSDGLIIAGHGSVLAGEQLGAWLIPVAEWECTDDEADAYLVADNGSQRGAVDNDQKLSALLDRIAKQREGLQGVGYSDDDRKAIQERLRLARERLHKRPKHEPDAGDDANNVRPDVPAQSERGVVYELGPHRVVCGDAQDAAAWALLMGETRAAMAWTDPPYGVEYVGKTKESLTIKSDATDAAALEQLLGAAFGRVLDATDAAALEQLLGAAFGRVLDATDAGGAVYVAAPPGPMFLPFANVLTRLEVWRQTLVWVKSCLVLGHSDFHYRHEAIFYGWKPGAAHRWYGDRKQDTILEFPKPSRNGEHPTMKPVELIERCIGLSSVGGDIVVDPFGGSGSTLIAADKQDRVARLIELDPRYVDVIRRRWTRYAAANNIAPGPGALEDA